MMRMGLRPGQRAGGKGRGVRGQAFTSLGQGGGGPPTAAERVEGANPAGT